MLGSLAKKLRMLGVDTAYLNHATDAELRYAVRSQDRVLLTRDTVLAGHLAGRALLVTGSDSREEFLSIAEFLRDKRVRPCPMSRCLECNGQLIPADPASVRAKVPLHILESGLELRSCSGCRKIYWKGTHAGRMVEEIRWMEEQLHQNPESRRQNTE
jgi:uncharacterized protein with PIN domain